MLERMERVPLCAACPAAQWYLTRDSQGAEELEAFCTQFRSVMYRRASRVVTSCDAREDAIGRATESSNT